ncbi:MAG: response regulator [Halobacteriaceae archaeon]
MGDEPETSVLVVDDEEDLADLYASWLAEDYPIRTATGGQEALEILDEAIDIVLLDRRMPDLSGDAVLDEIEKRDLTCRVAMVTAVDPDIDVIEMGFDDYIVKPVTREELRDLVANLARRSTYDDLTRRYFSLVSKQATLQTTVTESELEEDPRYEELQVEIEELRSQLDESIESFEEDDFAAQFHALDGPDEVPSDN